jgi:NAD(P)-dependent dehydrogenase (short-subunit alcohol dehydrogenase family)
MRPADRVVLVTGATGQLGRVVVGRWAALGARLALAGTDRDRLTALAAEHDLQDDRWLPVVGDLATPEDARAAATSVHDRFGQVDVLAHLVGGWAGGTPVVDLDRDEVAHMLDQHFWSTLNVVQAVVPGMVERGWGRVVAVTSPYAVKPNPKSGSYAVAKAAEETLLNVLAREVADTGVTVNLVSVRTIDGKRERESDPSPKNRAWTTPDEIASTLDFLCSDEAAAVNGARIPLDGRG